MAILKKKNLTKWIVFLPAFAVFLTFCIFLLIMVSSEKADYDKAVDLARKEYVKNSKAQAKERIDKLVDYINVNEQFLIREAKEEIKNIVTLGQKVILDTYQENPKLSRELLFEKLRTKLRDTRFFSDLSGYYFIYDLNGTNIMHGANRALEGLDLMDVQDGNGKYITKDILSLLAKNDGAYYDWTWKILKMKCIVKKSAIWHWLNH